MPKPSQTIQVLTRNELDNESWDKAVSNSKTPLVYAFSWYLDAAATQWIALVLNDYEAVMPLVLNKKWGITYAYMPFACQQLGIFSRDAANYQKTAAFLNAIPSNIKRIDYSFNSFCNTIESAKPMSNYELDLHKSYAEISKNYNQNCKRKLAKAAKANLQLIQSTNFVKVLQAFKNEKGKSLQLKAAFYTELEKVFTEATKRDALLVYEVLQHNNFIAGIVCISYFNRIIILCTANTAEGRAENALTLAIDYLIQRFANTEKILDFEGSNNASLAKFYNSFGSVEKKYFHLRINKLPTPLKFIVK
jgi:hypothetical protein